MCNIPVRGTETNPPPPQVLWPTLLAAAASPATELGVEEEAKSKGVEGWTNPEGEVEPNPRPLPPPTLLPLLLPLAVLSPPLRLLRPLLPPPLLVLQSSVLLLLLAIVVPVSVSPLGFLCSCVTRVPRSHLFHGPVDAIAGTVVVIVALPPPLPPPATAFSARADTTPSILGSSAAPHTVWGCSLIQS